MKDLLRIVQSSYDRQVFTENHNSNPDLKFSSRIAIFSNNRFFLRESVAYPVLISAETPPTTTTARNSAGGWARMGVS